MKIGYARVSTIEQHLDQQVVQLRAYGCEEVIEETASGVADHRPLLTALDQRLNSGDELVVAKLDRLSRSVVEVLSLVRDWRDRDIKLHSISEPFISDPTTGDLMLQMLAMFAQFESDRLRERTKEGVERARQQGKQIGAAYKLSREQLEQLKTLRASGESISSLGRTFGLTRSSVYRYLALDPKKLKKQGARSAAG